MSFIFTLIKNCIAFLITIITLAIFVLIESYIVYESNLYLISLGYNLTWIIYPLFIIFIGWQLFSFIFNSGWRIFVNKLRELFSLR